MNLHTLRINGYFDTITGYGRQNCALTEALHRRPSLTIQVQAAHYSERHFPIPAEVKACFVPPDNTAPQLLIQPPSYSIQAWPKDFVWLTSWEASALPKQWVDNLNKAQAVVTFSDWNATCFSASGVTTPIIKTPWFCPPGFLAAEPVRRDGITVFGCSGELSAGQWERKNLRTVIAAFQHAFPNRNDVALRIKTGEADYVEIPDDSRIEWTHQYIPQVEMQKWYASLDYFVHAARAEGWGFQPLEAMTVGRPVIASKFGGVAEYFDSYVGLEVPYGYSPAMGAQTGAGIWAEPKMDELAKLMWMAADYTSLKYALGENAKRRAMRFHVDNSVDALLPVLHTYGILQ